MTTIDFPARVRDGSTEEKVEWLRREARDKRSEASDLEEEAYELDDRASELERLGCDHSELLEDAQRTIEWVDDPTMDQYDVRDLRALLTRIRVAREPTGPGAVGTAKAWAQCLADDEVRLKLEAELDELREASHGTA